VIDFIAGPRATCPYKGQTHESAPTGRHMGLRPYHKSLFTAISDGECRIILLFLRIIKLKNGGFS